ncbi:hypothetical protein M9H77_08869 [Catharanthus roseus]|uniref:Uncharacterized protein n=1 Tax=Catharanthus roseus TaxID=4058 RepID=A0ACC0BZ77_CATRO|nr:hypothetical protein M9H77_08869 [Catharanthus roseus]
MWGSIFVLYIFVQVSRTLVVILLYPALWYFGYGLNWREAIIVVWSDLPGAVSLALSLSVKRSSGDSKYLDSETGSLRFELSHAKCKLLRNTKEVYATVRDNAFGSVTWPIVESYLMSLSKINQEALEPNYMPISDNYMDNIIKIGMRVRFLKGW